MSKRVKKLLLIVCFAFVSVVGLSIPIGGKLISDAHALIPAPVPEPSTMIVLGITGVYFAYKHRKR
jgi:hypothetical protein